MRKYFLLALVFCLVAASKLAHGSVLFEDLRDFQISGPVLLGGGQNASVCVTNLDDSPVSILIGLLEADTPSLLAVKQVTLAPSAGSCLNFTLANDLQFRRNVIGVVVPSGRVTGQGVIVQDRPGGGGCITASLQIQFGNGSNMPGQTFLYAPMLEHHERHEAHGRGDRD